MVCHHRKHPAIQVRSKITHASHGSQEFLFCCAGISLSSVQGTAGKSYREIPSYFSLREYRTQALPASVRCSDEGLKSGYFNIYGVIFSPFKV